MKLTYWIQNEISDNTLEISDMIKNISIKRNLLDKQILIQNF